MAIWDVVDWSGMLAYSSWLWCCVYGRKSQSGFSTDGDRSPLGNTGNATIICGAVEGPMILYKDIYLDLYQLIGNCSQPSSSDDSKLASYGALMVPGPDCCWIKSRILTNSRHLPILSDFRRVLEIGNTSEAYDELFRYFKFHDPFHETEDRLMQTLAYIDKTSLPHRIKGQVHMTGLDDDVCYPESLPFIID